MSTFRFTRSRRDYLIENRVELECGYGLQNHRKLPYFEPRPRCPDEDLCIPCEFALHEVLWQADEVGEYSRPTYHKGCVGWIDRLMETKYCPLCEFLVKVFFDACPDFPRDQVVNETNRRRFCCFIGQFDTAPISQFQPRADQWNCSFSIWFQEVSDYTLDGNVCVAYKQQRQLEARLGVECKDAAVELYGPHSKDGALLGLSRELQKTWNSGFMRDALKACREIHGSKCDRQKSVFQNVFENDSCAAKVVSVADADLRVVDVHSMCIVLLPKDRHYVALSYCWASTPYAKLTRSNFEKFCNKGGLAGQLLPPTVSDAIKAVKALGEQYIWIDSLCIIQDDQDDKAIQLRQMDDVYRVALLTIVAASASTDGSDLGLSGVRPSETRRQQLTFKARGLEFRYSSADLWGDLQRSRWHTRAWTFQEYLLSKRLLIIMPDQVYWICAQTRYAEDSVDHVCMSTKTVDEQALVACCGITMSGEVVDNKPSIDLYNYSNTYQDLIAAYAKRQMSFQSDGLNAARGMLNLLHREYSVQFLCGLPVPHLIGFFLTWCSNEKSSRRIDEQTGKPNFPSWSFIGWQGEVFYPGLEYPNTMYEQTFGVNGIDIDLEEEIQIWSVLLPAESEQSRPDTLGAALMDIDSCILCFISRTARLKVMRGTYGTPMSIQRDESGSLCRQITLNGVQVGAVIPHYSKGRYSPLLDANPQEAYEFVALSKSTPRWSMWYPLVEDDLQNSQNFWYENDEDGLIWHPPFDTSEHDVRGSVMNVLLIWRSDGIAYRAGVGQIHVDAWEKADPQEMEIRLG